MRLLVLFGTLLFPIAFVCHGQQPNLAAQREAMKKLDFLVGKWSGPASVFRGPGEPLKVTQTENVQFKLDGLVMLVEGMARNAEGKVVFQAMATIAFDESASVYRFRSYSDGHYLDTELKLLPKGFLWGYDAGPAKISNTMRVNEKGEWTEVTEVTVGTAPPRKGVEMTLQRLP